MFQTELSREILLQRTHTELSSTMIEHVANIVKVVCLIPVGAVHFRVGLDDPCWSFATQNIL